MGPPLKNLYQVIRGGSFFSLFLMRENSKQENPLGGGVLSINFVRLLVKQGYVLEGLLIL